MRTRINAVVNWSFSLINDFTFDFLRCKIIALLLSKLMCEERSVYNTRDEGLRVLFPFSRLARCLARFFPRARPSNSRITPAAAMQAALTKLQSWGKLNKPTKWCETHRGSFNSGVFQAMCFIADHESKLDVSYFFHWAQKHLIANDHHWIKRAVHKLLKQMLFSVMNM